MPQKLRVWEIIERLIKGEIKQGDCFKSEDGKSTIMYSEKNKGFAVITDKEIVPSVDIVKTFPEVSFTVENPESVIIPEFTLVLGKPFNKPATVENKPVNVRAFKIAEIWLNNKPFVNTLEDAVINAGGSITHFSFPKETKQEDIDKLKSDIELYNNWVEAYAFLGL